MESGLFKEATSQHLAVVTFHKNCRRDTLDMLSKAFLFGNYMKVIELNRFVQECSRYDVVVVVVVVVVVE